MEILQSILMGIVQGVTEFLPVSSTAHLILVPWFLGWGGVINSMSFDIALHVGTLLALLIVFFKDWLEILLRKQRLLMLLVIATIPGAVVGKLLDKFVDSHLRSPWVIAASLVVVGIVMYLAEKQSIKLTGVNDLSVTDAVIIGVSQAIAIIPGVSRSGITISSGLILGMKRDEAARFSFLMSTPIIAGAAALHGIHMLNGRGEAIDPKIFIAGVAASFVAGLVAITWFLKFLKRFSLTFFVYYRFVLAVVVVLGIWLKKS
ncbi:undecaprenyl-diphosphate phosphatase [Candidatus Magnetominusculus xianensis]|uniref:Undecaprenyl-diphosphatase n=1 Tax=Candidatus Magnetominusculus xianensis TaxID=1748249 RepID=A0ABR5SI10_9BACT|nr:undecaprenyl-diphosphate phosphatase [Candidatus Magnetominusculus xianensis]KWT90507.1 undecaprenyl-diphosphatase [Candidatus Magnetominusculus xianensis]MBF0404167.1 undecaprenyl-diphosphate phosphatase [Nitrospirota bacterium]